MVNTFFKEILKFVTMTKSLFYYLSFDYHVYKIPKKISKSIGILKNINLYLPLPEQIVYYNGMIKQLFMYCSVVWSSCNNDNISKLFKLQKCAARIILNAEPCHPSIDSSNTVKPVLSGHFVKSQIESRIILINKTSVKWMRTPKLANKGKNFPNFS